MFVGKVSSVRQSVRAGLACGCLPCSSLPSLCAYGLWLVSTVTPLTALLRRVCVCFACHRLNQSKSIARPPCSLIRTPSPSPTTHPFTTGYPPTRADHHHPRSTHSPPTHPPPPHTQTPPCSLRTPSSPPPTTHPSIRHPFTAHTHTGVPRRARGRQRQPHQALGRAEEEAVRACPPPTTTPCLGQAGFLRHVYTHPNPPKKTPNR